MGGSLLAQLHTSGLRVKQREERESRDSGLPVPSSLVHLAREKGFPLSVGCLKCPTGTGTTTGVQICDGGCFGGGRMVKRKEQKGGLPHSLFLRTPPSQPAGQKESSSHAALSCPHPLCGSRIQASLWLNLDIRRGGGGRNSGSSSPHQLFKSSLSPQIHLLLLTC